MAANGYPVVRNSTVTIKPPDNRVTQRQLVLTPQQISNGTRECTRCLKRFQVDPDTLVFFKKEECQYHPGRIQKTKTHARNIEQVYSCCGAASNAVGCKVGAAHVHELNRTMDVEGYKRTLNNDKEPGIFGIDCEMVYTLKGSELARVTIVDHELKTVLDQLVKPEYEVLDYNTEFSGLKKTDFINVKTALPDVQKLLCKIINAKSIIVGHSLESDLIALKLLHTMVIDTAIVFPHAQGPPFKRALRVNTLMIR